MEPDQGVGPGSRAGAGPDRGRDAAAGRRSRRGRAARLLILAATLAAAGWSFYRISWADVGRAFTGADLPLIVTAAVVNLAALAARGEAWRLLVRPFAPGTGTAVHITNVIGAAANAVSVSVAGDAVRVYELKRRVPLSLRCSIQTVVATRVLEGVTLALLIVAGPAAMRIPWAFRGVQAGAGVLVAVFVVLTLVRRGGPPPRRAPGFVREVLAFRQAVGTWRRMVGPMLLTVVSWLVQWLVCHWTLIAVGARPGIAASFVAMAATNLIAFVKLTPGNVGVFQAAMTASLKTLGVSAGRAFAASVALQAIQILPALALGLAALGIGAEGRERAWERLRREEREALREEGEPPVAGPIRPRDDTPGPD